MHKVSGLYRSCRRLYSPETLCESFFVPAGGLGGRGRWVSRETERWWLVNTVSNRAHNWSSRLTKPKPRPEALLHVTLYKAQPNRLVKHRAALWIETGWRGSAQIKQINRESKLNIHVRFIQKNKKNYYTSLQLNIIPTSQHTQLAWQCKQYSRPTNKRAWYRLNPPRVSAVNWWWKKNKKKKKNAHDALVGWPPDSRKQKVNNLTIFF